MTARRFRRLLLLPLALQLVLGIQIATRAIGGRPDPGTPPFFPPYDRFMDFFNVNHMSLIENRYSRQDALYPPFAYGVGRLFVLDPRSYERGARAARRSMEAGRALGAFFLLGAIAVFTVWWRGARAIRDRFGGRDRVASALFALFVAFNLPLLYAIDRGNFGLLAFAGLAVYVALLPSAPRFAEPFLAAAISFKPHLGILMALFVSRERWASGARIVAYGVLLNYLAAKGLGAPSFVEEMKGELRNIARFEGTFNLVERLNMSVSATNLYALPLHLLGLEEVRILIQKYAYWPAVLGIVGVAAWLMARARVEFEQRLAWVTLMVCVFPYVSFYYSVLLALPFVPTWIRQYGDAWRSPLPPVLLSMSSINFFRILSGHPGPPFQAYTLYATEQSILTPLLLVAAMAMIARDWRVAGTERPAAP